MYGTKIDLQHWSRVNLANILSEAYNLVKNCLGFDSLFGLYDMGVKMIRDSSLP